MRDARQECKLGDLTLDPSLRRGDQALVPKEMRQQPGRGGHQGGGAQAGSGLLPRHEGGQAL